MRRWIMWFAVGILFVGAGRWSVRADEEVLLAENGQAKATIVVGVEAGTTERFAADELAAILKQVTGATFEIRTDRPREGSCAFVGKQAAGLADEGLKTNDLGAEGILVATKNGQLILTGDTPRGTMYAVYSFLEEVVGCRWWSSKASTIPQKPTLKVGPLQTRYAPPLEYREVFWFDAFDGDWSARNKCNGQAHKLDEKRGGRHQYHGFVHTFFPLIPPDKYFAEHPDWFSMIDGKRKYEQTQLCLTNAAMREELIKNLKAGLKANPAATIASVSQNDCFGSCQCPACAAVDQEEGSPSGVMLRFVNAVAEEVCREIPQVSIDTLAYQYTRKPPKVTRPGANTIVRLCSIECSFSVPLEHERNASFRNDIQGWSKICDRLYIWDYTTNFNHYLRPHPNLRVIGPNIRFFVKNGVKGIFEQGAYTSYGADMAELRAWMLAKLLWNPNQDDRKLMREFLEGYYGPAADSIEAYLTVIHDSVDKSGYYLGCLTGNDPAPSFLPVEVLVEGWKYLKAAEKAAEGQELIANRVRMAQLPVLYSLLRDWKAYRKRSEEIKVEWPFETDPQAVYDRFMTVSKANQVTSTSEWPGGFVWIDQALEAAKK